MNLVTLSQVKTFLRIPSANTAQDDLLNMLIGDAGAVISSYCHDRRFEQDTYTEFYSGNGSRFMVLKQRPVQAILNVWVDCNGYFGQGVNQDGSLPFNDAQTLQPLGTYDLVLDTTINGPNPPAWDGAKNYLEGQLVTSAGLYYSCILAHTNQIPPNATYWTPGMADLLVSKSGLLARVNYEWPDLGAFYLPGSLAREGGQILGNLKVQYVAGYPTGFIPADLQYAARLMISIMRQTAPKGARLQSESVTDYTYTLMTPSAGQPPEIGSIRQILNRYRETPGIGGSLSVLPGNRRGGGW